MLERIKFIWALLVEPFFVFLIVFLEDTFDNLIKFLKVFIKFILYKFPVYLGYFSIVCIFFLLQTFLEDILRFLVICRAKYFVLLQRRTWTFKNIVKVFFLFFYFVYPIYIVFYFGVWLYLVLSRYLLIIYAFIILFIRKITDNRIGTFYYFVYLEYYWEKLDFNYKQIINIVHKQGLLWFLFGYIVLRLWTIWCNFHDVTLYNIVLTYFIYEDFVIEAYFEFLKYANKRWTYIYNNYIKDIISKCKYIYSFRYAALDFLINIRYHLKHTFIPIFLNYCYYIGLYYGANFIYFFFYYIYIIGIYSRISVILLLYWFNYFIYSIISFVFFLIKLFLYKLILYFYIIPRFIIFNLVDQNNRVAYWKIFYKDCFSIFNHFKLIYHIRLWLELRSKK